MLCCRGKMGKVSPTFLFTRQVCSRKILFLISSGFDMHYRSSYHILEQEVGTTVVNRKWNRRTLSTSDQVAIARAFVSLWKSWVTQGKLWMTANIGRNACSYKHIQSASHFIFLSLSYLKLGHSPTNSLAQKSLGLTVP